LATVRALADPATRASVTISNGAEDHASFATRAAVATMEIVEPFATVVACELVTAVRHLRRSVADGRILLGPTALDLVRRCHRLPADTSDRPLIDDVAGAIELLDEMSGTACYEAWATDSQH
jgi:histidine ammonia-lyase